MCCVCVMCHIEITWNLLWRIQIIKETELIAISISEEWKLQKQIMDEWMTHNDKMKGRRRRRVLWLSKPMCQAKANVEFILMYPIRHSTAYLIMTLLIKYKNRKYRNCVSKGETTTSTVACDLHIQIGIRRMSFAQFFPCVQSVTIIKLFMYLSSIQTIISKRERVWVYLICSKLQVNGWVCSEYVLWSFTFERSKRKKKNTIHDAKSFDESLFI